jgi:hypothetical protein
MDPLLKLLAFTPLVILVIGIVVGLVTGAMDPDDGDVGMVGLSLGVIFFGGVLGSTFWE